MKFSCESVFLLPVSALWRVMYKTCCSSALTCDMQTMLNINPCKVCLPMEIACGPLPRFPTNEQHPHGLSVLQSGANHVTVSHGKIWREIRYFKLEIFAGDSQLYSGNFDGMFTV